MNQTTKKSTMVLADTASCPPSSDESPIHGRASSGLEEDLVHPRAISEHAIHTNPEDEHRGLSSQPKPPVTAAVPSGEEGMTPTESPIVTAVQPVEDAEVAQSRREAADQTELVRRQCEELPRQNPNSRYFGLGLVIAALFAIVIAALFAIGIAALYAIGNFGGVIALFVMTDPKAPETSSLSEATTATTTPVSPVVLSPSATPAILPTAFEVSCLDFTSETTTINNIETDTIPTCLGLLTQLTRVDLTFEHLTGTIPSALGELTALTYLNLGGSNRLTGTIPSALRELTALAYLSLRGNQLTGTLPSALGEMTALAVLYLSFNQLTGTIPSALGELTALTYLELLINQLTGTIPSALGELTALTGLWLRDNQLTGTIPSALGELTALKELTLSFNQLTGTIPSALGELTALTWLHLENNQLTGTLPTWVSSIRNNDVSGNNLIV